MAYTIYAIIAPDGKSYVGMTGQKLKRRWANGAGYCGNERFYNDIKHIGWDNFEKRTLDCAETLAEAHEKEIKYIAEFESTNPDKGYNKSIGGWPCNKGLTEQEKKERQRNAIKRWEKEHPDKVREIHRKYDHSQKRHDWANAWNKTEERRKHRRLYMRKWRAEHPERWAEIQKQSRERRISN
jgi:hypothetical protein